MLGVKVQGNIFFWVTLLTVTFSLSADAQFSTLYWISNSDSASREGLPPSLAHHPTFQPSSPYQLTEYSTLVSNEDSISYLQIMPLLDFNSGANREGKWATSSFLGAEMTLRSKNKLFVQMGYSANYFSGIGYLDSLASQRGTYAGVGKASSLGDGTLGHFGYGRANFQAGKRVNLEAGYGKHFWGDGFRSLILSDNSPAYPYGKFELDVWRIRYDALYAMVKQGDRNKFFVTHGFSINATKRFQFSFFEMVIWQQKDSLNERTIDLHYLNPILFYRPVEYAQGSADNVLLGGGFKWRPFRKFTLYSQFVLDEFLLSEIRGGNGWWANKFGGQIGFDWREVFKNFDWRSEVNAVRPFTYSHGSPLQSWGNGFQPLAHPLGANFAEWVNIFSYSKNNWNLKNVNIYAIRGVDTDKNGDGEIDNLGGNIFNSYDEPFRAFGNKMFQGEKYVLHFNQLEVSRSFKKWSGLEYYISHVIRYEQSESTKNLDHFMMLGLRLSGQRRPNHAF